MLLIVWTLFVIMASAESAENNIGLVVGAEGMNAESVFLSFNVCVCDMWVCACVSMCVHAHGGGGVGWGWGGVCVCGGGGS